MGLLGYTGEACDAKGQLAACPWLALMVLRWVLQHENVSCASLGHPVAQRGLFYPIRRKIP